MEVGYTHRADYTAFLYFAFLPILQRRSLAISSGYIHGKEVTAFLYFA
jgi:hypothetical protein